MMEYLINSQDEEIAQNISYVWLGLAAPQINISKDNFYLGI